MIIIAAILVTALRNDFATEKGYLNNPAFDDGNAISLPFAKGFGWGAELNLTYIFEKLFEGEPGGGYPKERVVPEQRNKKILDGVRKVAFKDSLIDILKNLDQDLVKGAVAGEKFQELFFANCKNQEIADYVKTLLA